MLNKYYRIYFFNSLNLVYSFIDTRTSGKCHYFFNKFVAMEATEFEQKDKNLITLNNHKYIFHLGVHYGVKVTAFFASGMSY